ncbi:uncharacterized protein A4U43_C09F16160 [Asparagus officinalis]|uniref:Uncharacterized protein n=1 Tax=Asparagus officinalis TaxID=4686 RepID=A0A5P1E8D4_ASPOF|nr:uncharacterized protein A4U43_C09F16160 [Asparagus officinalis]
MRVAATVGAAEQAAIRRAPAMGIDVGGRRRSAWAAVARRRAGSDTMRRRWAVRRRRASKPADDDGTARRDDLRRQAGGRDVDEGRQAEGGWAAAAVRAGPASRRWGGRVAAGGD